MISPVRKTAPIGEASPRLVRVVDRAIDAVAEAEFAREVNRQPAVLADVPIGLNRIDDRAVIGGRQFAGDGVLEVFRGRGPCGRLSGGMGSRRTSRYSSRDSRGIRPTDGGAPARRRLRSLAPTVG